MSKQFDEINRNKTEHASSEPLSFFAQAFKKKYEAYCRGEKEAYINQQVWYNPNNHREGNYFQRWIIKILPESPTAERSISEKSPVETVKEKPVSPEKKTYTSSFFNLKMPHMSVVSDLMGSLSPHKSLSEKKDKVSLSRLFDEIELRPELLEQHDGIGEYELAQQNPVMRLQQVTQEVARMLLTEDLTELNANTISLVNEIQENAYEELLKHFEPV